MHSAARSTAGEDEARRLGRSGLVGQLLAETLAGMTCGEAPRVLDCGGGSGRFAVPLAAAGASVTVIDVSVDALATLRRRASEAGVADRITAVQGDVEALAGTAAADDEYDLVLAHGILEVLAAPPAQTFPAIVATVRPGGLLSVLVGNPVAAVIARTMAGDLTGAQRELARLDADADQPSPAVMQRLCAEHGLLVEQVHGIGVFRDLVPGAALDLPGAADSLAVLEAACAQRSPFAEIAGRVHVLARRPTG